MAKKRKRSRRPDTLWRQIEVLSVDLSVSLHPSHEKGVEPVFENYSRLELTGRMDQPVRGTTDVHITLYSTERATVGKDPVPWIGLVHGFKPAVQPSVFVPEAAFDRAWALATAGLLRYARLTITAPHYHSAYVVNLSVSSVPEE